MRRVGCQWGIVDSSDNDLPISGNSGEALHLQLSPSGSGPPDPAGKVMVTEIVYLLFNTSVQNSLVHSSSLQSSVSFIHCHPTIHNPIRLDPLLQG